MYRGLLCVLFCAVTVILSPAQSFTVLAHFVGPNGANPVGLTQATDGNFYGTTEYGGTNNLGAVFKITPQGALTTLYSFCSLDNCADGANPEAGLVQASDGNFYGTTNRYNNCCGTVFKISPEGQLKTLYTFCSLQNCADGAHPTTGLVQAKDGNFYGTTSEGGANQAFYCGIGCGTVFKITPEGMLTTLYRFCSQTNCIDGAHPDFLVQGSDGNFYGTTSDGGNSAIVPDGGGTVFKITSLGELTTLYSFCSQSACSDGSYPTTVVQASDGNLYGTTASGGLTDFFHRTDGTVFKVTQQGELSTLYKFCSQTNCIDGASPYRGFVQATDGNFYGTTETGGDSKVCGVGCGTVFQITPVGMLTTLHSFGDDGNGDPDALLQASDGDFYGTTYGNYGVPTAGNVYRLDTGFFGLLTVGTSGSGTVSSTDAHIYCGTVCTYPYAKGTQVTLSPLPSPGYTFSGWTGCDNVNGGYCSITMSSAKNVTATFNAATVTLTSLTFKPSYVRGGQLSAGTLTLSAPAPSGGVTVALSSDHPGVAHPPAFVFVPGNASSVQFAVQTLPVKSNTTVTITATAGGSQISGTLMVGTVSLPPALK